MTKNTKAYQRDLLIMEFGILIQPLTDLEQRKSPPTLHEHRIAKAKVTAGKDRWEKRVKEFTKFSDDLIFRDERQSICEALNNLMRHLDIFMSDRAANDLDNIHEYMKSELKAAKYGFMIALNKVPIEWEPVIFEANTPFTSYLKIKEAMALINNRLHYFDRYLKVDFFSLFLRDIDRNISLRLITTEGNDKYGVKNVIHISKLASQEFKDYQLIQIKPDLLHDRNLRIDNRIFSLGPSIDQAGMALTNFSPTDNSDKAHSQFDRIILEGIIIHKS